MRTNYDYLFSEGFVLNQTTGKLEEFIPTKIIFDFQTESIIYKGLCGGVENSFDEEDFKLYKDVESFKRGVEISDKRNETIHSITPFRVTIKDDKPFAWTFKKGEAVLESLMRTYIIYNVDRVTYSDGSFTYRCLRSERIVKSDNTFYWDRDAAIAMNDIVVVDRNGNEKVVPGIGKRMALNEEQSKALKAAEAALNAMKDLGICLGYDNESDKLFAFNKIPNAEYSSYDEADGYVQIDGYTTSLNVRFDAYCGCDGLWVRCED